MGKIICHEHCPKGGHGGGGLWAVLVVVAIALVAAGAHQVAPAVGEAVRTAARVAGILAATAGGLAVLAGLGWLAARRQDASARRENAAAPARRDHPAAAAAVQGRTAPREAAGPARAPLAIEAPRPWARETSGLGELAEPDLAEIRATKD